MFIWITVTDENGYLIDRYKIAPTDKATENHGKSYTANELAEYVNSILANRFEMPE